jgi:hypothetical protein
MDTSDKRMAVGDGDERVALLRESIRRAFPAEPYSGKITISDDYLADPEMRAEKELHDALQGRRWTDVPSHLFRRAEDTYGILTEEAYPAFLAAWLMYSLEDMDEGNEVREFLVYSFQTMRQFRVLNADQRLVVRSLLSEFKERDPLEFIRDHATEAIRLIDRGRY